MHAENLPLSSVPSKSHVSRHRRQIFQSGFLYIVLYFVVVISTVIHKPYFGNMDDGKMLQFAEQQGPLAFAYALSGGVDAGFIRTSSMLIIWPTYWIGATIGSTLFYLANVTLVFLCLTVFGLAMGRLLRWKGAWLGPVFLCASLLWPYTAELFFYPSLSEKGVILGAGLLFWWVAESERLASSIVYWTSLAAVVAFAFTTKTHILVFVPAIIYALWERRISPHKKLNNFYAVLISAFLVATSILLLVIALMAPYTQSTRGSLSLDFLNDRRFMLLALLSIMYVTALFVRAFLKKNHPADWLPAILLISMCGAFAVWDMRNYFLAIASVMVGSAVAVTIGWIRDTWKQVALAVALFFAVCCWLLFRLPAVYTSLASVGEFIKSPIISQLEIEGAAIYMSCIEAPDHYNKYIADAGFSGITFKYLGDQQADTLEGKTQVLNYVFADKRLCPWEPESVGWETVWTTGNAEDFKLFGSRNNTSVPDLNAS
jgi:hypothetical protein